jgi:hypothetical protein
MGTSGTPMMWLFIPTDRLLASQERKRNTCCKGVLTTNEQMRMLAAVRAAFVAAETSGLTKARDIGSGYDRASSA